MAGFKRDANGNIIVNKSKAKVTGIDQTKAGDQERTWFQKGTYEDGYKFGDLNVGIGGTVADILGNVAQGVGNFGEGVSDLGLYLGGGLADLFGFDSFAEEIKKKAQKNTVNDFFDKYINPTTDKDSFFGEKIDTQMQNLGYVLPSVGVSLVAPHLGVGTVGVNALTTGGTFASSMGSGMSEAYNAGATDSEAWKYGLMSGGIEAGTELMFGGLGGSARTLGLTSGLGGLDDILANKLTSGLKNRVAKTLVKAGVKATGEGVEEVAAGYLSAIAKHHTYATEKEFDELVKDENLLESFIGGVFVGGIFQGGNVARSIKTGRDIITGFTSREEAVVDALYNETVNNAKAKGQKLTKSDLAKIREQSEEAVRNGEVSVELIEKTLGGDAQKGLDALSAEADEFDKLYKTPGGELSREQQNRLNELEAKNKERSFEERKKEARQGLRQSVRDASAKDQYIGRAYVEEGKRYKAFSANASEYKGKGRAVVENAMKAKFLNDSSYTHKFVDLLAKLATEKGIEFDFTSNEKLKNSGFAMGGRVINGFESGGKITVNMNAAKVLNSVVGHEITHVLEGTQLYSELQTALFRYAQSKKDYNGRRKALEELYKDVKNADVNEELMADLVGDYLFTDEAFIRRLSTENKNLFEKIFEEIKYLARLATAGSKEARELERVKRLFEKVYKEADVRKVDGMRFSVAETNTKLNEIGLVYDADSETVSYSLTSLENAFNAQTDENGFMLNESDYQKAREEYVNALAKSIALNKGKPTAEEKMKASKYLDGLFLIHDMIAADRDRLDYEAAVDKSAWVSNSDYGGSIDFSTLCAKRRLFTGTFDAIQNELPDTVLDENDFLKIRDMLLDKELESPCSMCYVEGSRAKHGVYVDKFLKEYLATNPEWKPQIADFTSSTRLERTRIEHPEAYAAYQKAMNKLAQRKPKEASVRTDYKGEILVAFADGSSVEIKNQNGGIRFNSFSDFEIIHALDCMQVITDMARVGLNGQSYTKVKEFAESFGNTGLKINLSLVAKDVDADGKLVMDEVNGMKYSEAMDIRNKYSDNVGTVIVVFNDAQLKAALADSTIDFVLPFHRSQWKKSQYAMMGLPVATKDYTSIQNDRIRNPKTGKPVKLSKLKQSTTYTNDITGETFVIKDNIMPNMYWDYNKSGRDNANRYLDYINANGMTPKFDFLLDKIDGKWVLPEDAVGDGYFKLLIDFKMYNNEGWGAPQNPVLPEFNMPYIQQMLDNYIGGHQAFPVAHDVVDQFVKGKKSGSFSLSKENASAPIAPLPGYNVRGEDIALKTAPLAKNTDGATNTKAADNGSTEGKNQPSVSGGSLEINELRDEITNLRARLDEVKAQRDEKLSGYQQIIDTKQALYDSKANKDTKVASNLMASIEHNTKLRDNAAAKYDEQIRKLESELQDDIEQLMNEEETARLTHEPVTSEEKQRSFWSYVKELLFDKGMVFETLGKKHHNRFLESLWNQTRLAEPMAQHFIQNGVEGVDSINDVRKKLNAAGTSDDFEAYMYHLHNSDRMRLGERAKVKAEDMKASDELLAQLTQIEGAKYSDARALIEATREAVSMRPSDISTKTKELWKKYKEYNALLEINDKPVFGKTVTAEISDAEAARLLSEHPEFKEYADAIYANTKALRQMLVDSGIISQDAANMWDEMYPHYVPIKRDKTNGSAVSVPLDSRRTGVNVPVKKATGGNSDIGYLFSTLAERAEQTFSAVARNEFGKELRKVLALEGMTDLPEVLPEGDTGEGLDAVANLSDLDKTEGGEYSFTVFEGGKRRTFEVTEEMYDALKPRNKFFNTKVPLLGKISTWQRNVLTQYNPVFWMTNFIKDAQDVVWNSQHAGATYKTMMALMADAVATKGKKYFSGDAVKKYQSYIDEYAEHGGEGVTYFDRSTKAYVDEVSDIGHRVINAIVSINEAVERLPRLAEYIASREAGRSIEESMLDASRVTTNFQAGGDLTKWLNKNGFTFLNASVQGAVQSVRNVREAYMEGAVKGTIVLAAKLAALGLPALILNALKWKDDEEYEQLSDYVKDNYYVIGKNNDGTFIRIPKGRMAAVISDLFEQVANEISGEGADFGNTAQLAISNLAPNNPVENFVLSPVLQAYGNKTWYGEDLIPTRLQNLPREEQYDESTDTISVLLGRSFVGKVLNLSPYQINYLLNQYLGGIGDFAIPMLTPEVENRTNWAIAPFADKFTTNANFNSQYVSDFYDTMDELTKAAQSMNATDEDKLRYKYFLSQNSKLSELYKQKREVQAVPSEELPDKEKYNAVSDIQEQINKITKQALDSYENVVIDKKYATVGDVGYYWYEPSEDAESAEPGWHKISDDQLTKQNKVCSEFDISASEYWNNREELNYAYDYPSRYIVSQFSGGYETYRDHMKVINKIESDKDENGDTISGSRKKKVLAYILSTKDLDANEKMILYRSLYSDPQYNRAIVEYLAKRSDISYENKLKLLAALGFKVGANGVYW